MSEELPVTEKVSPGRALAAARAELKLSVADVSQQIKYGTKQIAAIEADDYAKLPGATFVRGMIRSYAKLVQIDPEPLLVDLGRRDIPAAVTVDLRTSGQEPFVEGGAKSNRVYVLLSIAALLAVAVVAYQWWANPLDTGVVVTIMPKTAKDDAGDAAPVAADSPSLEPAPATEPPAPVSPAEPAAPDAARAAEPSTEAQNQTQPPQAQNQAQPEARNQAQLQAQNQTTAPAAAAADSAGELGRIELRFDELSWVQIKQADGKVLLSQLNRPGTMQVIEGVPPFDVVIGNAAKVRAKYNDTPLDLRPFFKVDVARLKLE